jgi:hypothetical protein
MRRLLPLLTLLAIPFPSAALADGCPPASCGTTSVAPLGSKLAFVFPEGRQGPLWAYDLNSGRKRFVLPSGMLSADGSVFVSAVQNGRTMRFVRYDTRTGHGRLLRTARGYWNVVAISADGRRIARFKFGASARKTIFTLDDPRGSGSVRLPGTFQVDALSPDGRRLFLVHWNRTGGYDLQQYDRATGRRSPTRLADPDEKMTGQATGAVATRDGHWQLTLYVKGNRHTFIHALDLRTGVAHCIDLPLLMEPMTAGALALSPDQRTLYVADGYAGSVATIDLSTLSLARVTHFRGPTRYVVDGMIGPTAAVTPNGRMLAFSAGTFVWLYDTAFGVVRPVTSFGHSVLGLGFRPDGRRLLVVQRRGPTVFLDAATGGRR